MKNNTRLYFLDYLRIFAFLSVLIGHKLQFYITEIANNNNYHIILNKLAEFISIFTAGGGAGVVVFFLISGYIISHAIQNDNAFEFLFKRFFRIYPLFILAVIIEIICHRFFFGQWNTTFSNFIATITLTGDLFNTPYALAGVEWTLRLEVLFYLLAAVAKKYNLWSSMQKTVLSMIFLAIVMNIFPFPHVEKWANGYTSLHITFLFMGVCFYAYEKDEIKFPTFISSISILYLIYLIFLPITNSGGMYSYYSLGALMLFYASWICRAKFQFSKLIIYTSSLTYSIYLFHNWLWNYIHLELEKISSTPWLINILTLCILFLVCIVLEKTVETPFVNLGKYLLRKLKSWSSQPAAQKGISNIR